MENLAHIKGIWNVFANSTKISFYLDFQGKNKPKYFAKTPIWS